MQVYDHAHALARALKESNVYQDYLGAKEKVEGEESAREMLHDYQEFLKEIQEKYLKGEEITKEQEEKNERLKSVILLNTLIKNYFEAEHRLGVVLMDIQKIISEAVL